MTARQRVLKALNHQQADRVHNIQAGVPAHNIVAMFDAAYEYGFYSA